ncbi:MAG: hypothetical protein JXA07_12715 [Spirochaetes bacterium]|nr:hypothetical protein [Spirochaetota bacterium]
MAKEINVAEEVQRFKTEIVPLMNLNELEALQKFLKGVRLARGQATRTGSSGKNHIAADVVSGIRSARKHGGC